MTFDISNLVEVTLKGDDDFLKIGEILTRNSVASVDDVKAFLNNEIKIAESKLQPHDTGHIHTAIAYMKSRLEEIEQAEKKLEDTVGIS